MAELQRFECTECGKGIWIPLEYLSLNEFLPDGEYVKFDCPNCGQTTWLESQELKAVSQPVE